MLFFNHNKVGTPPALHSVKRWRTPEGDAYNLFIDIAQQHNVLVAGEVGSGKSCVINGVIQTVLYHSPAKTRLILIDPKRTELFQWRNLPHVLRYASEQSEQIAALQYAIAIMDERLDDMQQRGLKLYDGADIYIIIDELADLLLTNKKQAKPLLQRLLQLSRASKIHVIAGSQCVNATVINTELRVNMTAIVGLRTATKAHSRLLVERPGCELFPDPQLEHKAYGFYKRGCKCDLYELPYITDEEQHQMIDWWTSKKCVA